MRLFLLLPVFLLTLASCAGEKPRPPLPTGMQTLTGILQPAELSLVRRGTHILLQNGEQRYFVESAAVHLRQYEGKEVTLRGFLEENSDPSFLPVLKVQSVESESGATRPWTDAQWGIEGDVPEEWQGKRTEGRQEFSLSGSMLPFLTIQMEDQTDLPAGTPIMVGGKPGIRILDEDTGVQTIAIPLQENFIVIRFIPPETSLAAHVREDFLHFLRTFHVLDQEPQVQSSSGSGIPCGGPAGILCPAGQYCEVTDRALNIGKCAKL